MTPGEAMTIEEAMGIAAEVEAIGTQIDLLSNGHALVTLAAEVRRLRAYFTLRGWRAVVVQKKAADPKAGG